MKLNKELLENDGKIQNELVIISEDAKSLYVKIQPKKAGEAIEKAILESEWKLINDAEESAKFLAINLTPEEIQSKGLNEVLPSRDNKIGMSNPMMNRKPTTKSLSLIHN